VSAVIPVAAQQRMCHGKRVHLSFIDAVAVALKAKLKKPRLTLRVYQCPNCSFWHLTKKPLEAKTA
jgi:hypothetical protein